MSFRFRPRFEDMVVGDRERADGRELGGGGRLFVWMHVTDIERR